MNIAVYFDPITTLLKRNIYDAPLLDRFSYRSVLRKKIIQKSCLNGCIDNHHIIPKQFKNHDIIHRIKYKIDFSYNIAMLPNAKFRYHEAFKYSPDTLIHERSHVPYSKFVEQNLNEMSLAIVDEDTLKYEFWLFHEHLKHSLHNGRNHIPWNEY